MLDLGFLLDFDLRYLEYSISSTILLLACFHSLIYSLAYALSLLTVSVQGEKCKVNKASTRIVAGLLCLFYISYNAIVYFVVLSTVDWSRLFRGRIFARSVFDHKWAVFLFYEPIVQLMTSWFKIGCAIHSLTNQPSIESISGVNLLKTIKKNNKTRKVSMEPCVTVIMPIYNEPLPSFMTAVNSVVETIYPNHRLHLVLAFDDDAITPLYRSAIYCLKNSSQIDIEGTRLEGKHALEHVYKRIAMKFGQNHSGDESYPLIHDIEYRGLRVTPCRFPHGGKRHAQMCAYKYLAGRYDNSATKPLLLLIDSDIQLDPFAINYFVSDLIIGRHREALTGLITCKTADTYNFLKVLQDTEYIESQMMQRTTEDYLGSVSCLPGALTMVRFESLESVAKYYFNEMGSNDSLDFARCHLGEDRYFTHLLMEREPEQYRIGYCSAARCKTEGCSSLYQLMKQRRRWYLGTLGNEIHMLCSPLLWKHVPGLLILQLFTSLKNGPLFLYVFMSEQVLGRGAMLSLIVTILIFGPIWLFVAVFGVKIHRRKIAWCYPFIVLLLPILSAVFQFYGLWTLRVRSWGGPRASAAKTQGKAVALAQVLPTPRCPAQDLPTPRCPVQDLPTPRYPVQDLPTPRYPVQDLPTSRWSVQDLHTPRWSVQDLATPRVPPRDDSSSAGKHFYISSLSVEEASSSAPGSLRSWNLRQSPSVVIDINDDKKIVPIHFPNKKEKTSDYGVIRPRLVLHIPDDQFDKRTGSWSEIQVRDMIP